MLSINIIKEVKIGFWGNYIFSLAICTFIIALFFNCKAFGENKFLILCGKYSLQIYLIHSYITAANRVFLFKIGINNIYINIILNLFMAIIIPLIIATMLEYIGIDKYVFKLGSIMLRNVKNKNR